MISDMHVHTRFSSDSTAPVEQQIERAIELGMRHICITDHQDYDAALLPPDNFPFLIGDSDDTASYFAELSRLKQLFEDRIEVLIGVELGLQGHLGDRLRAYTQSWPFDFIIGSSHYFGGMDGGDRRLYEGRSAEEACRQYFTEELENVTVFHDFDVIGHMDFVLRHAPGGVAEFRYNQYGDILDEILLQAIRHGKGIECNTCPLRDGGVQPNPNMEIVKRYVELGGEIITFGSDAHTPDRLGDQFDRAAEMVKSCGIKSYAIFKNHEPIFIPL